MESDKRGMNDYNGEMRKGRGGGGIFRTPATKEVGAGDASPYFDKVPERIRCLLRLCCTASRSGCCQLDEEMQMCLNESKGKCAKCMNVCVSDGRPWYVRWKRGDGAAPRDAPNEPHPGDPCTSASAVPVPSGTFQMASLSRSPSPVFSALMLSHTCYSAKNLDILSGVGIVQE